MEKKRHPSMADLPVWAIPSLLRNTPTNPKSRAWSLPPPSSSSFRPLHFFFFSFSPSLSLFFPPSFLVCPLVILISFLFFCCCFSFPQTLFFSLPPGRFFRPSFPPPPPVQIDSISLVTITPYGVLVLLALSLWVRHIDGSGYN